MATLRIEKETGTVYLPDGSSLNRSTTPDAFKGKATAWGVYKIPDGAGEGTALLIRPYFKDSNLLSIDLTADLDPNGPKDWSNYSLEAEAAVKRFHDAMLVQMLGKPSQGGAASDDAETLSRPLRWHFSRGNVHSYHDSRGGGTFITVTYQSKI